MKKRFNPDSYREIGAQKYNKQEGVEVNVIWGCSTTADEWKFLKLEDNILSVDLNTYYIDKLDVLLGVFHQIFEKFVERHLAVNRKNLRFV